MGVLTTVPGEGDVLLLLLVSSRGVGRLFGHAVTRGGSGLFLCDGRVVVVSTRWRPFGCVHVRQSILQVTTPEFVIHDADGTVVVVIVRFHKVHDPLVVGTAAAAVRRREDGRGPRGTTPRDRRDLLVTDPVHDHVTLALDGDLASLLHGQFRGLFRQEPVGRVTAEDPIRLGVGFHATAGVDGIAE